LLPHSELFGVVIGPLFMSITVTSNTLLVYNLVMNILFLCTANIHRSKTAEDHFSSIDSAHTFQSAGLSRKYCAQYGSKLCTISLLDWADAIYVMEPLHAKRITENAGERYTKKVKILNIDDIYKYMQPELLNKLQSNTLLKDYMPSDTAI
jgi:predicted protein tyrosine phosphatase